MKEEFDAKREGSGTAEWAEVTENICRGCPNNCLYCYAAHNANRFGHRTRKEWHREEFTKRAKMKSYPMKDGVVMFPSSHDITPFNLDACIRVMKLILSAGNRLLIVSKPREDCIPTILIELAPWKDQILFRFTIGSVDSDICAVWEPGAPSPGERIMCLRETFHAGFRTSVSIEPMLAGAMEAVFTVASVKEYVTDTIWIGKMNKIRTRVAAELGDLIEAIEELQSDKNILWLYDHFKNNPMIRWKDSINEVVAKNHKPIRAGR